MKEQLNVVEETPTKTKEAVVKGKVMKPSLLRRINTTFFGSEGFKGAAKGLVVNSIIPVIQDGIVDYISTGVQRMVYGNDYEYRAGKRHNDRRRGGSRNSNRGEQYARAYRNQNKPQQRTLGVTLHHIEFDTRAEAQSLYNIMVDNIEQYNVLTVADYYELCDVSAQFTDHSYGWQNLNGTEIVAAGAGRYYLRLPLPIEI